jgi:hypothetical protein
MMIIIIIMMMMMMNLQALFCSLRWIESFMIFSAEALGNLSTNRKNAEKRLLLTVGHAAIYPWSQHMDGVSHSIPVVGKEPIH